MPLLQSLMRVPIRYVSNDIFLPQSLRFFSSSRSFCQKPRVFCVPIFCKSYANLARAPPTGPHFWRQLRGFGPSLRRARENPWVFGVFWGAPGPKRCAGQRFCASLRPKPCAGQRFPAALGPKRCAGQRFRAGGRPNRCAGHRFCAALRPKPCAGQGFSAAPGPKRCAGQRFCAAPGPKPCAGQRFRGALRPKRCAEQRFCRPKALFSPGNPQKLGPIVTEHVTIVYPGIGPGGQK
jgi:hypothetical protein